MRTEDSLLCVGDWSLVRPSIAHSSQRPRPQPQPTASSPPLTQQEDGDLSKQIHTFYTRTFATRRTVLPPCNVLYVLNHIHRYVNWICPIQYLFRLIRHKTSDIRHSIAIRPTSVQSSAKVAVIYLYIM